MTKALPEPVARAYALVAEHLPAQKFAIRRLIEADRAFCELCEEFAEAQAAMAVRSGPADMPEGENEWEEIVDHLRAEILNYITGWQAGVPRR